MADCVEKTEISAACVARPGTIAESFGVGVECRMYDEALISSYLADKTAKNEQQIAQS